MNQQFALLRRIAALILSVAASAVSAQPAPQQRKTEPLHPNIILILTDDMGYGDVTCNGAGAGVATPNIDRIARGGMRFTHFYTAAPICSPSRAGILTGRFPSELRINSYLQTRAGNIKCEQDDFLDPNVPTLPRILKSAGYTTSHFGKWHMGGGRDVTSAPSIARYGFDEFASTWESPNPEPALGVKYAPWDRRTESGQVPRYDRTRWMVDRTLRFLEDHRGQPCYVNLWPDDVHTPHRPSPAGMQKFGASDDEKKTPRKNFLAVLDEYDHQIGRLLDGLTSAGLDRNTVVIFTSDNGPEPHFNHTRTGGLRGMKLSLYEGGIRVPFIVRWPGRVAPGTVNEKTVLSGVDLFPTICTLAQAPIPAEIAKTLEGEDLSQAMLGTQQQRTRALLWEYGRKPDGYGYPRLSEDKSPNVAIREGQLKLLLNDDGSRPELFDVTADPVESQPLDPQTSSSSNLADRALKWRKSLSGRRQ